MELHLKHIFANLRTGFVCVKGLTLNVNIPGQTQFLRNDERVVRTLIHGLTTICPSY